MCNCDQFNIRPFLPHDPICSLQKSGVTKWHCSRSVTYVLEVFSFMLSWDTGNYDLNFHGFPHKIPENYTTDAVNFEVLRVL